MGVALQPNEPLSRFLIAKSWVMKQAGKASSAVFMPREGRTSVYRTAGWEEARIWETAQRIRVRQIFGKADVAVSEVIAVGLEVNPDDYPEGHAAIAGWPDEAEAQLERATVLAEESRLQLLPEPIPGASAEEHVKLPRRGTSP